MNEQTVQQQIRMALSTGQSRVFRNNVGAIKDQGGRLVTFGLCKGSSDLIGWQSVTVTPDMVGQRVAIFLAVEVKGPKTPVRPEQENFIARVRDAGGLAGIARSVSDAITILNQ
jgi:hypothetical protein